jgi:ABC-2 type transport system ATP-binding protein
MIQTHNLTRCYRQTDALHNVSLEVPRGSVFALAGPNGAGKSTATKILMNLLRPTSGRAELLGVDSTRLGPRQRARIGYFSEDQHLPEWMKVSYFLNHYRAFYPDWDDALASGLIRRFAIPLNQRLRNLSRGMKVKAALTASLAYRPELIILDEPFSGLDLLVREQLIETLVDCTPEATVLLASHDLAEIESFATHVAYLNAGRLEFVEEMAALSSRFREVEITLSDPTVPAGLPAHWLNPEHSGSLMRFTDSSYQPGRLLQYAQQLLPGVHEVQTHSMSLRSIFLALAKSRKSPCA